MTRAKMIPIGLLTVFAFSGIAAASASAEGPIWLVNGVELKAGETAKTEGKGVLTFVVNGLGFTVACEEMTDSTTLIGGDPGKNEDHLQYKKCMVAEKLTKCKVEEPIDVESNTKLVYLLRKAVGEAWKSATENEWLKGPEKGEQQGFGNEFTHEAGKPFFKVKIEKVGAEVCPEEGVYEATGAYGGVFVGPGLLEFTKETSALLVNGKEAFATGLIESWIVNGKGEKIGGFEVEETSAPQWYKCTKVEAGKGKYANNKCTTEGSPKEFELNLLKELLSVTSKQTSAYAMEGKLSGVAVEVKCETEKGTGSIHNGETTKVLEPGKGDKILVGLGLLTNEFSSCTVPKPAGQECKIKTPLVAKTSIQLSTGTEKVYVLSSADPSVSSTVLANLTLEGCKISALNGTYPIEGMTAGLVSNTTSSVSYKNEEPNKRLLFGGNVAKFTGESVLEMGGGGFINAH